MSGLWDAPQYDTSAITDAGMDQFAPLTGAAPEAGGGLAAMFSGGMAGPWGMAAQAVLGGVESYMAEKAQKKNEQRQARQRMNEEAYSKALGDWYNRRDKAEWRSASNEYAKFSNIANFAPNYKQDYQAAALGDIPTTDGYVAGNAKNTTTANNNAQRTAAAGTVGGPVTGG